MPRLTTLKPKVQALGSRVSRIQGTQRITGRRLQEIRYRVLTANPLCVACHAKGIVRLAEHVDHITALVNGGSDDPIDDSNRQGLCSPCHDEKTRLDLAEARGGL
jgi:5-methylcytosine-specific restriction endonuclease McrA